jgi:hypothetical protein
MPVPANSDLSTLFAFVKLQVVPTEAFGDALGYRDLEKYYTAKEKRPSNDLDDVKKLARRALHACGLDKTHQAVSTLNNQGQGKRRAASAAVLAMSIIKNTPRSELQGHYNRLMLGSASAAMLELKKVLTYGDEEVSKSDSNVALKNFTSAGMQKGRYMREVVEAFTRSRELLLGARQNFILVKNQSLSSKVNTAFQTYFGAPAALANTAALAFDVASATVNPPAFGGAQVSSGEVVREVLRRVCQAYLSAQKVRFYFGGKGIDDGAKAYVTGSTNPTKVHVAQEFFAQPKSGAGTQAGTLVHELTHTWARTDDHEYGPADCQNLAGTNLGKALTNADNYRFFVEAAFG